MSFTQIASVPRDSNASAPNVSSERWDLVYAILIANVFLILFPPVNPPLQKS